MPRSRSKTRAVKPADAVAYVVKAAEFLRAAQDSLQLGNRTAATGNAVHAGIAASDAIAAALVGSVSQGDHADTPGHLDSIGGDARVAARQLRQLLPLKSLAEYDPRPMSVTEARRAVTVAERLVALAERVVSRVGRTL
jgi:HEPN domain-containing protein